MKTIRASETIPADGRGTAAFRITLSDTGNPVPEYVTHFQNVEDMERAGNPESGKSWGHYFDNLEEAQQDFKARVFRGY